MVDISKVSPERKLSYCKAQYEANKQYLKMEISDEFRQEIELSDSVLEIAIEATEYRVSKNYVEDTAHQEALCPTCSATLEYTSSNEQAYCEKCGQKLQKGWRAKR